MKTSFYCLAIAVLLRFAFEVAAATASANVLTFTGKIDSVPDGTNLFRVGDPVMFKLTYNANNIITRAVVSSGESDFLLYGSQGRVYIDADPVDGSVLWQVPESENFDLALGTGTDGTLPCIGDFEINDFTLWLGANICAPRFQVHGHLTALP